MLIRLSLFYVLAVAINSEKMLEPIDLIEPIYLCIFCASRFTAGIVLLLTALINKAQPSVAYCHETLHLIYKKAFGVLPASGVAIFIS